VCRLFSGGVSELWDINFHPNQGVFLTIEIEKNLQTFFKILNNQIFQTMMTKSKYISLKTILISIGVGIWVIVLQNAGIIPTKQNVYVKGGPIDANIKKAVNVRGSVDIANTVRVRGSVDVDNTVSVSIDEVLGRDGRKYYYNNH